MKKVRSIGLISSLTRDRVRRLQHSRPGQQLTEGIVQLLEIGIPRRNPGGHNEVYPGLYCTRVGPHPFPQPAFHSITGHGVADFFADGKPNSRHTVRRICDVQNR